MLVSSFSVLLASLSFFAPAVQATAVDTAPLRAQARTKYTRSHALAHATPGASYDFSSRDGWESVNITDMKYKYRRRSVALETEKRADEDFDNDGVKVKAVADTQATHTTRSSSRGHKTASSSHVKRSKAPAKSTSPHVLASVDGTVKDLSQVMSGTGKQENVIITWYTGEDLLNPSCWENSDWAPTDNSFAAALTLEGWTSKPQCFKFLELCHSALQCVFVRVVDTCAGCAAGSKHVDLTRAAFGELADFDVGELTVHMRPATDPMDDWYEELWGPKN